MEDLFMRKLCFMFGHRDTPASVLPDIERAVEKYHLEYGIDEFIVGHHGAFDRMAAQAVRAVQNRQKIRLTLLLAYHPSTQKKELLAGYDSVLYPDGMETVPPSIALPHANRYMLTRADAVICYVAYAGNTRSLLAQAEKRTQKADFPLTNLADSVRPCPIGQEITISF